MSISSLISVIIPVYNAESFISNCIDSVLNQTYKNIEIVVVDDGSTDETAKIINKYKEQHQNIIYVYQPNQGCSFAKNTALEYINGDFVQYLDADDVLSLDKIELQIEAIYDDQDAIAVCKTVVFEWLDCIDPDNDIDTKFLCSTNDPLSFLLNLYGINGRDGMIQPNAFLVPRKIINDVNGWDTSISPSPDEDGEYFCRVILNSSRIVFTEGINYYRKISSIDSLSKKKTFEYAQGALKSILLKKQHVLKKIDSQPVRKMFAFHLAKCAYVYGVFYPSILKNIYMEIDALGFEKVPNLNFDGRFGFFSKWLGFKNAINLRQVLIKLKFY